MRLRGLLSRGLPLRVLGGRLLSGWLLLVVRGVLLGASAPHVAVPVELAPALHDEVRCVDVAVDLAVENSSTRECPTISPLIFPLDEMRFASTFAST